MSFKLKRAYEPASPDDGERYLVERLWPRGVSTESLHLSDWLKELAPSAKLRRWYSHDSKRWSDFVHRYEVELSTPDKQAALAKLAEKARAATVTLVFAARDTEHSSAIVLKGALDKLSGQG